MSKYLRGMKAGAAPFVNFSNEQSENFRNEAKNINEKIDSINENISDIIDLIEMDENQRTEFINEIKSRKKENIKPRKFRIDVIYSNKDDFDFSDNLRKSLHNQGNVSHMQSFVEYKNNPQFDDYNIFIRDSDKLIDENSKIIFSAYGSEIFINNNQDIIATYSGKIDDKDRELFITYYANLVKEIENTSKKAKKAKNALNKRKKTKIYSDDELMSNANKIMDFAGKVQEGAFDICEKISDKIGLFGVILEIPIALVGTVASIGVLLLDIPFGINEAIMKLIVTGIINSNFDTSFVSEAQRQILEIKLCEYISTEQIRLI